MLKVITAPEYSKMSFMHRDTLFLAGGITGCPLWQLDMIDLLKDLDMLVFNPRRPNFPIDDLNAAEAQITWEHQHLSAAISILFWFPCETLCPIVLYELGRYAALKGNIFVGVHPKYPRRKDVEIQMSLVRPDIEIVYSLEDLAQQIRNQKGGN